MTNVSDYRPPHFLKRFIQVVGLIGVIAGAAMFELENSFLWHPRLPKPESGMVIPYHFKGVIFYISSSECFWINTIYIVFFVAWGIASISMFYVLKKSGFPIRGENAPPRL
jgi:hypothetical protein